MYKILIVDDEQDLHEVLEISLKQEGYRLLKALDGESAIKLAMQENPHLILLDVMMPGMNGLDVCRELRKREIGARIIMLTAKAEEIDRVVGLEMGADDYISKPFSLRELQARIHARLRHRVPGPAETVGRYQFDTVELDFEKVRATKKGKPLDLTSKEFDVLKFLIRHRGQVVTRDRLLEKVWGYEAYTTTRTVDNHILRLRRKLEPDQENPRYILSVYGGGYKFVG